MPHAPATYIYLDFGFSHTIGLEIDYSLSTLLAEIAQTPSSVVIYTDRRERYTSHPVSTVDISGRLADFSLDGRYPYRIKLLVLLDACQRWGGTCVYLDSDTFIEPGLSAAVAAIPQDAAAMHKFEGQDPVPAAARFKAELPGGREYRYGGQLSSTYNSGVVLVHARGHARVLRDALALYDAFIAAGIQERTLEQIAVSEAFRIHGIAVFEMHATVVHYWSGAKKRFMHAKIAARARAFSPLPVSRPAIVLTRGRVRLRERAVALRRHAARVLKMTTTSQHSHLPSEKPRGIS